MKTSPRHGEAGIALVAVILILALLMGLAIALTTSINMDTGLRGAYHRSTTGFYAAESGLNRGMGDYRNIFLSFNVPTASDFATKTISVGTGSTARTVTYQITDRTAYDGSGNPPSITIPPGLTFGGLNSIEYDYIDGATATSAGDVEAQVNAEFKVGNVPLFQFVAFYANDLEIAPGQQMNLNGRVHTNGNLYLNAGVGLSIADNPPSVTNVQVSAAKDIYRGRKDDGTCDNGNSDQRVSVDMQQDLWTGATGSPPLDGSLDPKWLPCGGTTRRLVPTAELSLWKGSMLAKIQSIAIPLPSIVAKSTTSDYWQNAELRIVLRLNANDKITDQAVAGWGSTTGVQGQQLPHTIEVQDASGNQNGALTTALHKFMTDEAFNAASSTTPGVMPIFYTDVPTQGTCGITDASPLANNPSLKSCYNPAFLAPPNGTSADVRVYRTFMGFDPALAISATNRFDDSYRRGGFYNWRERKWMLLLNINVSDLLRWNSTHANPLGFSNADATDGGLVIFASVQGPNSAIVNNNYGVRIFGSADLSNNNRIPGGIGASANPTGLTFASDQAVYVLGDYNSVAPRQPAAILGDSVNVMSNNYWVENGGRAAANCANHAPGAAANAGASCNSVTPLCNDFQSVCSLADLARNGANTTINTAFLSGVDTTIVGTYNGGFENYPRFHEDWGGLPWALNYSGSYVSLGTPTHVNGIWCGTGGTSAVGVPTGCNIYNPPVRNWNYDSAFNNVANLPPLTPRFVYVQQVLFTEQFK